MPRALALANNDVVLITWRYEEKLPGCLGFEVVRRDTDSGVEKTLPAWVGWAGGSNKPWKARSTAEWPVQKYSWRDLITKRGGPYVYRIIPLVGTPGVLKRREELACTTNPVQIAATMDRVSAWFNRGILATQHLRKVMQTPDGEEPSPTVLRDRIDQPGDPLRNQLAGEVRHAVPSLLERARLNGGKCYLALYELSDPELLQAIYAAKDRVEIVLSNTGKDDHTNAPNRAALHELGIPTTDRMLDDLHIGHNKFVVYVDAQEQPQAVLTGSTNWTPTGLCGQTNNALLIEDPDVARTYLDYWKALKKDGAAQGAGFRTHNRRPHDFPNVAGSGASLRVWFSPNTPQQKKPTKNPPTPVDMEDLFAAINAARHGVLFLAFIPGSPSIVQTIGELNRTRSDLFLRGAITNRPEAKHFAELYHRAGERTDKLAAATEVRDEFAYWRRELLKLGHAIVHDKVVVIDPLSEDCKVITGSHNLGFKASYSNDENLLMFTGHARLAQAYAAHVMDVYDHYRWRWVLQTRKQRAWTGLEREDRWQDKYFRPTSTARRDWDFWLPEGTVVTPAAVSG